MTLRWLSKPTSTPPFSTDTEIKMNTIDQLIKDGNALFSRITLDGEPDWQGEGANIPDDAYPEEGGPSTTVAAADASTVKDSLTVDQLSEAVLEGLTGVSREWLSPVRPFFDRLAALAKSKQVTDEDFLTALEKAQTQLPEIFDLMDSQALEDAFSNAIGSAALAGSVSRYEP